MYKSSGLLSVDYIRGFEKYLILLTYLLRKNYVVKVAFIGLSGVSRNSVFANKTMLGHFPKL